MIEPGGEDEGNTSCEPPRTDVDFGLGVAQIVITAATPMVEEAEKPFPPSSPPVEEIEEEPDQAATEVPPEYTAVCEEPIEKSVPVEDPDDDQPTDSAPFPISSSTGSEEDSYTGPSTAENSQSHPVDIHKSIVSCTKADQDPLRDTVIPDELEPHQLARLQDLKESDA